MPHSQRQGLFPPRRHDHGRCLSDAIKQAESLCVQRGVKFTPIRRRMFEIVWSSHKPIGAYDILACYNADGAKAAPPTVYRALEFLIEQGLVHRIESMNAYIGCSGPGHDLARQFLICTECGQAAEVEDVSLDRMLIERARDNGFAVIRHTVEMIGLCADCQKALP